MDRASNSTRLSRWRIRLFGVGLIVLGGSFAAFGWASLQRPELKVECQYDYTADPACKRAGLWAGLVFAVLGLPFAFAPSRRLDADRVAPRGRG